LDGEGHERFEALDVDVLLDNMNDLLFLVRIVLENDFSLFDSIKGVVPPNTNILPCMHMSPALTNKNIA
jgi:hypothetical protein